MFQRIITWLVVGILGLVPLMGASSAVVAQTDSGFPDEIVVEEIATGEVPAGAVAPGTLYLDRVVMPAAAGLPVHEVATGEILYIEQGTLTVADGLGLSSSLQAGKSVYLRAGSSYTAINDGAEDVVFLRLSFVASLGGATPVAVAVTETESSGSVETTALATAELTALPVSPANLFLSRATWGTGVDSGEYTQTGAIGYYTETGTLTISSPSGIEGQLDEGKTVLLPADSVLRTRNDGTSDAVALLFGVIPANGPAVVTSGASVSIDPSKLEGLSESSVTPSGVLYQADTNGGLAEMAGGDGWQTVSGMLVNDGTGEGLFKAAPFQLPTTDYAVEVEMQWVRGGDSFGIVARMGDTRGYHAGYYDGYDCRYDFKAICLWGADYRKPIAKTDLLLNSDWHVYRLEVQGNTVRVFVDGTLVIETSDNSFLSAGKAGLWSDGAQVNIRRFTISSLGDG